METLSAQAIIVKTKEDLDAALPWAEQIVVEGDDDLLSYAASKAARDPANNVDIDLGRDDTVTVHANHDLVIVAPEPDHRLVPRPPLAEPVEGGSNKSRLETGQLLPDEIKHAVVPKRVWTSRATLWVCVAICIGLLAVGTASYFSQGTIFHTERPRLTRGLPAGPNGDRPTIVRPDARPVGPTPQQDDWASLLPTLVWPAVATVAIVALFLIARQAIAGGRNVEITWKLTEKVSGRVVITKVKGRAPSRRKAS